MKFMDWNGEKHNLSSLPFQLSAKANPLCEDTWWDEESYKPEWSIELIKPSVNSKPPQPQESVSNEKKKHKNNCHKKEPTTQKKSHITSKESLKKQEKTLITPKKTHKKTHVTGKKSPIEKNMFSPSNKSKNYMLSPERVKYFPRQREARTVAC